MLHPAYRPSLESNDTEGAFDRSAESLNRPRLTVDVLASGNLKDRGVLARAGRRDKLYYRPAEASLSIYQPGTPLFTKKPGNNVVAGCEADRGDQKLEVPSSVYGPAFAIVPYRDVAKVPFALPVLTNSCWLVVVTLLTVVVNVTRDRMSDFPS